MSFAAAAAGGLAFPFHSPCSGWYRRISSHMSSCRRCLVGTSASKAKQNSKSALGSSFPVCTNERRRHTRVFAVLVFTSNLSRRTPRVGNLRRRLAPHVALVGQRGVRRLVPEELLLHEGWGVRFRVYGVWVRPVLRQARTFQPGSLRAVDYLDRGRQQFHGTK